MKFAQVGHCQDGVRQGEAAEKPVDLTESQRGCMTARVGHRPDSDMESTAGDG